MLESLRKNQMKRVLVIASFFLTFLSVVANISPVFAIDTCSFALTPPSSTAGYTLSRSGGASDKMTVGISGAVDTDKVITAQQGYTLRVDVFGTGAGRNESFPISNVNFVEGGASVDITSLVAGSNKVQNAGGQNAAIGLRLNVLKIGALGIAEKTVCVRDVNVTVRLQNVGQYNCTNFVVKATKSGTNQVNLAASADASSLGPGNLYVLVKGGVDVGSGWAVPLNGGVQSFTNMNDGNYQAVITSTPQGVATTIPDIRGLIPAGYGGNCVTQFSITRSTTDVGTNTAATLQDQNVTGKADSTSQRFSLCTQIPDSAKRNQCLNCLGPNESNPQGLWTAVGCIQISCSSIVSQLIKIGLSLAGGVAILMILAAAFMLSTSQGDQKRTGEAKDLLTSAIIGLLFIIFSVSILQFVGKDLLKIPGFGAGESCSGDTYGTPLTGPR